MAERRNITGVTPDVTTLGKVIGGGFPLAAIVGRRDIMAHFDKSDVGADKWLMQLGTLSGNPIAAAAGLKSLEILNREGAYDHLLGLGDRVSQMIRDALGKTVCRSILSGIQPYSRLCSTRFSHWIIAWFKTGMRRRPKHGMTHCAPMASSNHPVKPIQV
jgi:glutamate-1-semialdehyde aminotransferase